MNPLIDEQVAISYAHRQALVEVYQMITDNICVPCIENKDAICQNCKVIDIKELITERMENA